MKKLFYSVLLINLIIFSLKSRAQIVIDSTDFPQAGDSYPLRTLGVASNLLVDLNITGANSIWDFSFLNQEVGSQETIEYVTIFSTPFAYQFFFNNPFIYPNNRANYAISAPPLPIPPQAPITVNQIFNYYKLTENTFEMVGFGANINGVPTSNRYTPTDIIYKLPLTYGDTSSSNSAYAISVPGFGYYGQRFERVNEVDGYGQVILPSGTYDAIRVKSVLTNRDTIFYNDFNFGLNLPPQTVTEYKWLAKGEGIPVLEINTRSGGGFPGGGGSGQEIISDLKYKDGFVSNNLEINDMSINIFPNPVNRDENLIVEIKNSSLENQSKLIIEITDINGKVVTTENIASNSNLINISTSHLKRGMYFLRINDTSKASIIKKFVVN